MDQELGLWYVERQGGTGGTGESENRGYMTVNLVLVERVVKDGVEGSKTCIIVLLVLVQGVVVMAGGGVMVPIARKLLMTSKIRCCPFRMFGDGGT